MKADGALRYVVSPKRESGHLCFLRLERTKHMAGRCAASRIAFIRNIIPLHRHVSWQNPLYLTTKPTELARQMVCAAAGLHGHGAG